MIFALFVLGAVVGSFLNVCIWRLPRGESVMEPPSHCPRCNTRLQALDLVPILSQVLLRARCRYCHAAIAWRYCGIEVLTGVLFSLVGISIGANYSDVLRLDLVRLAQLLLVVACLLVIFWVDYERAYPHVGGFAAGLTGVGAEGGGWGAGAICEHNCSVWDGDCSSPLPQSL
jgi:leader peptidase (prepilin peptidase)/N-methyltransferase